MHLAASQKRLDEFGAHVEAARRKHPDWTIGGNVTLGWVRHKQGKLAEAKELFNVLRPRDMHGSGTRKSSDGGLASTNTPRAADRSLATSATNATFNLIVCGIAVDLARAGDFDGATSFYELASDTETVLEHCRWFGKEPVMQQLAVRIVNRMLAKLDNSDELNRQAGSPLFTEAAKIMAEINQPYSAARLAQAMITRWQLPGANNSDGGVWLRQLEDRFASARAAIKPEMLPDTVAHAARVHDLLPHVTGDSLANLRLDSPFVSLLSSAAKDKDVWTKWTAALRRAGGRQPPDRFACSNW